MDKFLIIAQWNANGLLKHKDEIMLFLKQNFIDILLISETHFTEKSYFKIPNYVTYHTNHPDKTGHAGTAILIKQSIKHYALPKYEEAMLQATSIKVLTLPYELTVAAVYCPPRHNIKKEDFEKFFHTLGPKFISGGDFNSKHTTWGSRLVTTKGRELLKVIQQNKYDYLSTGTPTYWPTDQNKTPDLLDLFIINGISKPYTDISASFDLTSDHTPIIATISACIIRKEQPKRLHNPKTDWELYRHTLHESIDLKLSLKKPKEVDDAVNHLNMQLITAVQQATPAIDHRKTTNNIPLEIKQLVAQKRKARAQWQRTHHPSDKTKLNNLSNLLKAKLKNLREDSFKSYVSNLNRYDNSIWKPIRSSLKPQITSPPIRKLPPALGWAKSAKEKADLFAYHLSGIFLPHEDTLINPTPENPTPPETPPTPIPSVTPKDIKSEIQRLNLKKTPGLDQITSRMLRELPRKGIVLLTYIFNAILRLQYWPTEYKKAEIVLIPKPGKEPSYVTSYRPISLLSVTSKLLERLVLRILDPEFTTTNWIPDYQFGFRKLHSTTQQCHRITQVINTAFEEKSYCIAILLDVSQAFDKVWHKGLIHKIQQILPPSFHKLLESYLSHRQFRTRVNDETSALYPINSGVPQGSVLGPFLYLLFTSDLPTTPITTIGTFADDTIILAKHNDVNTASSLVQSHLNLLEVWLNKWKITVNETKSSHVTFTLRREQCPPIYLNNIEIPQSTSMKYLGLHLDNKLTWRDHINKKKQHIELRLKNLYWLIGRTSSLSLDNKLLLYKTIIKPIWTYGVELWGCASKSNVAIMQRCQSKILRAITNAPWYLTNQMIHEDLGIPFITQVIQDRTTKHLEKIAVHTNPLLSDLPQHEVLRRLKRRWPTDLQ